jgi:hypothetical protein
MSFYNSFDNVRKMVLLFCLLTPSMVIFAEASDTGGAKVEESGDAVNQSPLMANNFPRWPERQRVEKEIVPPPPPGPYMSLGLNDFPVSETPFGRDTNNPHVQLDISGAPVQAFSPDEPWPKNIRPTKRWMPENGYQYIEPQAEKNLYPAMRDNPANNYYSYPGAPYMAWPGANNWSSPTMGAPAPSYRYTPDYGPRYNASANTNRPPQVNPNRPPQVNPAYRVPYPAPSKP